LPRAYANLQISRTKELVVAFGEVIAEARKKLDLTQKELATRIRKEDGEPISPQYLNDLERNRRNPPSELLIREFARELRLPEEYLLYVAGTFPEDARDSAATPEQVEAAFRAFRRTLRERP
jgi:transcriptional regulator with XRE-family HTH domain